MRRATRGVAIAAALGAVLTGTAIAPTVATAAGNRVITVKVTKSAISFDDGTTVAPGFAVFDVRTPRGHRDIQLQQLADGYTPNDYKADADKAFGQGNLRALARIYENVDFQGGATATEDRDARFAVTLRRGTYIVTSGEATFTRLHVSGAKVDGAIDPDAVIRAVTSDDGMQHFRSKSELPHRGWLKFRNAASQPHFVLLQQVAKGTTRSDVNEYFQSGSQDDPPWIRAAFDETGLVSPDRTLYYHYRLPRGRYLVICFMPDLETGAPHGVMGMFRLITLV
jgi:hypothetical protein